MVSVYGGRTINRKKIIPVYTIGTATRREYVAKFRYNICMFTYVFGVDPRFETVTFLNDCC